MSSKNHCRCRVCGARQKKPGPTLRSVCRACGRRGTLRIDKWMQSRWRTYRTCCCQGYWFPHRLGSGACWLRVFDREAFEERAAIIESEGGLPRDVAEGLAAGEQRDLA